MKRGSQPDLFAWAASRPTAEVVEFLSRRETLPRWVLSRRSDLECSLLHLDRLLGTVPPAPIYPLKREA